MSRSSTVRRRQRLALAGLASIALFVLALVALHATALGRLPSHMSQFANSPYGLFWALALYGLILGTSMVVWALRPCLARGLSKRAGLSMLAMAALGALLLATFPADSVRPVTWQGTLHDEAAATTLVMMTASMIVLAPAFHSSPAFARFAVVSLGLGAVAAIALTVYLVTSLNDLDGRGPAQRVLVGAILAWFAILAVRLLKAREPEPVASEPVAGVRRRKSAA